MFDTELLPPPDTAPPWEIIDSLVEDAPGAAEPVRWSEYLPDGMLADLLVQPVETGPEYREFEALERVGGWERVVAWAQARQMREMSSFMRSAQSRNRALGASDSQAHESAVAEVGLMLSVSARAAACRVGDAWSLCTRLPATLAALESGRITLAQARILDAETLNLSAEHTAHVEAQVLAKAGTQTPGQLRAATRRAVLSTDPAAAQRRAERARRERGVQMWPESDGMATLSAYLPAADAVGVFAVLDEHARRAGSAGDERSMQARRGDALVDLVLNPTGYSSEHTSVARRHTTEDLGSGHPHTNGTSGTSASPSSSTFSGTSASSGAEEGFPVTDTSSPGGCRCECGRCRRGGGVDVRVTVPYTALLGADDQPGEIAGYGPIPAAVARDLAAGGTWRRILTDPASGRPLDYGTTRYRPPRTPRRTGDHPGSDLPVPRLPDPRPPLRPRPWHSVQPGHRDRPDQRDQHRPQVPAPSPDQTDPRLVGHPPPRRLHHLDHSQRPCLPLPATTTDRPRTTHHTLGTRSG